MSDTAKNVDPTMTWSPWNPVAIKKVEPKDESDMQNGASWYSNAWKAVKTAPSVIVVIREVLAFLKFPFNISWCDHVMVTPEESNKIVFSNGILIGLNELILVGGHICPSSMFGEILL
jgi:hypothetical protein